MVSSRHAFLLHPIALALDVDDCAQIEESVKVRLGVNGFYDTSFLSGSIDSRWVSHSTLAYPAWLVLETIEGMVPFPLVAEPCGWFEKDTF